MGKSHQSFKVQHPIIFTDIDGVLNGADIQKHHATIHPECVIHFNRLLAESRAQVVITSAWREVVHSGLMTPKGFGYMLSTHGVFACEVVGVTASDVATESRGAQVADWCKRYGVSRYVVIDDVMHDFEEYRHPFVKTNGLTGLAAADVNAALLLLEQQMARDLSPHVAAKFSLRPQRRSP